VVLCDQGLRFGFVLGVGGELVIPIGVGRPALAHETLGVLPILAALRTNAAGVEGIPNAATKGLAMPAVPRLGYPVALGAEYFHIVHSAEAQSTTEGWEHGV
jgi:hypothetical protein